MPIYCSDVSMFLPHTRHTHTQTLTQAMPSCVVPAAMESGVGKVVEEVFVRPLEERPCEGKESNNIPVIDVGAAVHGCNGTANDAAVRAVAEQVGRACEEWGFFQVVNHGIPASLILNVHQATKDFFHLPAEVKNKIHKRKGCCLGYNASPITHATRDWRESIDISPSGFLDIPDNGDPLSNKQNIQIFHHNQWPSDDMPHLRMIYEEYMQEVTKLSFTLLSLVWQSLGLPPTQHEEYFKQSTTNRLRVNHYLPCSEPDLVLGFGAHKDMCALAIIHQDAVGGLQVKHKDGEWINVPPNPRAIVVNLGDVMQVLTNDKYFSAEHRVIVKKNVDRYSIAFALNAAPWANVSPIMELTSEENPPKYKTINWGKYTKFRIEDSPNIGGTTDKLLYYSNTITN